jgi:SAM-dependent methyltransferase
MDYAAFISTLHCPACERKDTLHLAEVCLDVENKVTAIAVCDHCLSLVNASSLHSATSNEEANHKEQTGALADLYKIPDEAETIYENIEKNAFIADLALKYCPDPLTSSVVDIGYGRGYGLLKLSEVFEKAYGVEFFHDSLNALCTAIGRPDNLVQADAIDALDAPVDIVIMWHFLEHLQHTVSFLREVRRKTKPGGHVLCQTPLYRKESIFSAHYTFFNHNSLRLVFEESGFDVVDVAFDYENSFITIISTPAAEQRPD